MSDDPSKTKMLPDGPAGELPVGAELSSGMYRVTGRIAAGGFGITYEARDNLDRKVAIKECFPAGLALRAGDFTVSAASASTAEPFETARNLFLREARTLAALRHPNIVHVQTLFEENGTAYMAMDYIEGRDLQHIIDHEPEKLTPAYIMELTRTCLGALDYLHRDAPERGKERLLHRDIKPANIRIDPLDTPVIIDFGAARQETKNRSRAAGTFRVVSDGYSPNEFYVAGTEQGPASDLYSLAATLYHCITGAAPAPADERAQKVSNGEEDPYEPVAGRFPGHDPRLLGLIDRALARPLKDRPADAAAWFAAIPDATTRIVETPPAAAIVAPAPVAAPAPEASTGGFWKGAAVGGLALALLGGGAVALDLLPGGGTGVTDPEMQRQLDAAEEARAFLEGELATMSGMIEDLESSVSEAETLRDAAVTEAQSLEQRVADLSAQLAAAEEGDAPETTVLRNQLNQAITDRETADSALTDLEDQVAELQNQLAAAQEAASANTPPEMSAVLADRDAALARADELEAELAALEEQIASGEGVDVADLDAARAAAVAARDAALLNVDRARADLQRMAADLSEAEEEADRLNMELRAARAEIELMLANATVPNPGPNTLPAAGSAGACPTWAVPGQTLSYTGTDIYTAQTLTARASGSALLSACPDLPFNVSGFAEEVPTFTLQLSEMEQFRRLELQVVSDCDTTLLVNTQDTVWHFDDNSNGGVLPLLNLTGLAAIQGRIDVWIGTIDGAACDASLEVETWLN
ncbi:serine/threonine-protein kinase [Hasllibacter sp. MH4015]|uniref:protein kinase domain-containing protein n=1 Tax=Hasllibacter sp. MH4015 TaxID=2854029 RepID=UPI001CD42A4B|nr:serine/threonine-protein kinase [Hasllibacter sp. MH4015]